MMTAGAGAVIWAMLGVMMLGIITGGHQERPQPHRADRGSRRPRSARSVPVRAGRGRGPGRAGRHYFLIREHQSAVVLSPEYAAMRDAPVLVYGFSNKRLLPKRCWASVSRRLAMPLRRQADAVQIVFVAVVEDHEPGEMAGIVQGSSSFPAPETGASIRSQIPPWPGAKSHPHARL